MNYEEYRDRMKAQGRMPVPRERYESQIKAGYMLANLDKDEFCALPDRAIAELSRAANKAKNQARELEGAISEVAQLRDQNGKLADAAIELEKLAERLICAMTIDQHRRLLLDLMAAAEKREEAR